MENWLDQHYCAAQLRLQISGEPECWINKAEESGEDWVQSGDAIVERFDRHFVTEDGIEMAIRHARKLVYMCQCINIKFSFTFLEIYLNDFIWIKCNGPIY